jgi:hypothetical protein
MDTVNHPTIKRTGSSSKSCQLTHTGVKLNATALEPNAESPSSYKKKPRNLLRPAFDHDPSAQVQTDALVVRITRRRALGTGLNEGIG